MRVIAISDTHGMHDQIKVPMGDVLVHCGDFCNRGTFDDARRFAVWLSGLPHKHKIVIAGNHDRILEEKPEVAEMLFGGVAEYLFDSETVINGVKFYGSPWQPEFCNWAFNLPRGGAELAYHWAKIPEDVDVLITHGPPKGILDRAQDGFNCGCELLRLRISEVKPKYHLFGHIHEGRGMDYHTLPGTTLINATTCTLAYRPTNEPVVFEVEDNNG